MRKINIAKEKNRIISFIKKYVHNSGFKKGIIGLSGGLDSSVSAYLTVEALGKENVIGILMPYKTISSQSLEDGKLIAENLSIKYYIREISPMVDSYFDKYEKDANVLRRGNRMARERMCILYDLSAKESALVIGTGNKTEIYLGYVTQFGDSACAIEPLGHLYKTEVLEIAKFLNIPSQIINKTPSADLWQGQTDEDELGIKYEVADEILYFILDEKLSNEEIMKKGFSIDEIVHIKNLMEKSEFKRRMPLLLN
ncbi:MAG: NAD+ synthase [Candidatus Cloacimonadota bacterium]|nr:NAD+ synthase [Candidatus Cloacimonadota bacterium]